MNMSEIPLYFLDVRKIRDFPRIGKGVRHSAVTAHKIHFILSYSLHFKEITFPAWGAQCQRVAVQCQEN